MERLCEEDLPVSPFFMVPVGQIRREAIMLLGPRPLARLNDEIASVLHRGISAYDLSEAFVAQVFRLNRRVVASTTIRTRVGDPVGDRPGQKVTLGVWISPGVFSRYQDVT